MNIMDLSAGELLLHKKFTELAEEAKKASETISESFPNLFCSEKSEITVFRTEARTYSGVATLNSDAIWKYSDNYGNHYEVDCTPNGIFKCYRSRYLIENGLAFYLEDRPKEEKYLSEVAPNFRKFIEKIST